MDLTAKSTALGSRDYEDFVPSSELVKGEESDTLILELPGFKKEQLKVHLDKQRNLRASGERPLDGDRWRRFRKEVRLPENCNVNEIHAKFENGILTIALPKLVTEHVPVAVVPPPAQAPEPEAMPKPSKPEPNVTKEENEKGVSEKLQERVANEIEKGKGGIGIAMKKREFLIYFAVAAVVMVGVGMYVAYKYRRLTEAEGGDELLDFYDFY